MNYKREELSISGGRQLYLYSFTEAEETAKKQAKHWGYVADAWRNESEVVEAWFEPVTKAMVHALPEGGGILIDVGCGAMTMRFPTVWSAFGIDVAKDMRPNVVGDEARLPLVNECADAITSRFSYMFSHDPRESFVEARRCLKPTGTFVFAVWSSSEENDWAAQPMDYLCDRLGLKRPDKQDPHAFRLADADEVTRMLESAGFTEVRRTKVSLPYFAQLEPGDALTQVLSLAGPIKLAFDAIPANERKGTLRELQGLSRTWNWGGAADVWTAKKWLTNRRTFDTVERAAAQGRVEERKGGRNGPHFS